MAATKRKRPRTFKVEGAAAGAFCEAQANEPPANEEAAALRVATLIHVEIQLFHEKAAAHLLRCVAKFGIAHVANLLTAADAHKIQELDPR